MRQCRDEFSSTAYLVLFSSASFDKLTLKHSTYAHVLSLLFRAKQKCRAGTKWSDTSGQTTFKKSLTFLKKETGKNRNIVRVKALEFSNFILCGKLFPILIRFGHILIFQMKNCFSNYGRIVSEYQREGPVRLIKKLMPLLRVDGSLIFDWKTNID